MSPVLFIVSRSNEAPNSLSCATALGNDEGQLLTKTATATTKRSTKGARISVHRCTPRHTDRKRYGRIPTNLKTWTFECVRVF